MTGHQERARHSGGVRRMSDGIRRGLASGGYLHESFKAPRSDSPASKLGQNRHQALTVRLQRNGWNWFLFSAAVVINPSLSRSYGSLGRTGRWEADHSTRSMHVSPAGALSLHQRRVRTPSRQEHRRPGGAR